MEDQNHATIRAQAMAAHIRARKARLRARLAVCRMMTLREQSRHQTAMMRNRKEEGS